MQPSISNRASFLKKLERQSKVKECQSKAKECQSNKKSRRIHEYINSWIERNYSDLIEQTYFNSNILANGESSFDRMNNAILSIYKSNDIDFKNQSECDVYMEEKIRINRFLIRMQPVQPKDYIL